MAKKESSKKKELTPIAIKAKGSLDMKQLRELKDSFSAPVNVEVVPQGAGMDSLFASALDSLNSGENIDMKTDYEDDESIFASSVLDFIGQTCDIPMLSLFIEKLDRKKVSKNRKGRQEDILVLQRRGEEESSMARQQAMSLMR